MTSVQHIDGQLLTLLLAVVIPLLVSYLTKSSASTTVKQVVSLALSAIGGTLVTISQTPGNAFVLKQAALATLLVFGTSLVTYLGVYKPHDIASKTAPTRGLG